MGPLGEYLEAIQQQIELKEELESPELNKAV